MYGLIATITAVPDQRDALIQILLRGTSDMPGCVSYEIAEDAEDPDRIWITEVWTDQASHDASLQLPAVQAAIATGRPLISGMRQVATTKVRAR